jgi:hypothetical protein
VDGAEVDHSGQQGNKKNEAFYLSNNSVRELHAVLDGWKESPGGPELARGASAMDGECTPGM